MSDSMVDTQARRRLSDLARTIDGLLEEALHISAERRKLAMKSVSQAVRDIELALDDGNDHRTWAELTFSVAKGLGVSRVVQERITVIGVPQHVEAVQRLIRALAHVTDYANQQEQISLKASAFVLAKEGDTAIVAWHELQTAVAAAALAREEEAV